MKANVLHVLLSALRRGAARPAARRADASIDASLTPRRSQRQRAAGRRSLWRHRGGAAGVYVAVTAATMVGMVGLALDLGRFATLNTQAQDAADAAALAAASQLDGTATATTRAYNAAQASTGLATNYQGLSSAGAGAVTIQSVDFLHALPASDSTPITSANILCSNAGCTAAQSAQVNFVRVTTNPLAHQNWFIPVVGAGAGASTGASAVAGNTKIICRIPPLFACNPDEPTGNTDPSVGFNVNNYVGKEVVLKSGSNPWAPGNFGLLQSVLPNCTGLSTTCIDQQIADISPDEPCVGTTVNVKPGVVNGMREAINTRFDMWENPGFQGQQNNANYAPAPDVTKGLLMINQCSKISSTLSPPQGEKIPRDTSFGCPNGNCGTNSPFGNGMWDCATYWSVNHPGVPRPGPWCAPGATADANGNFPSQSRFAMYQNEINNGIPNNSSTGGENGNPTCAPVADTADGANRRIIYFALVNCQAYASLLNGNSCNASNGCHIPTVDNGTFVKAFVTEPALNPSSQETDIVIEVEGVAKQGDGVLHDIVQLYR